MPHRTAEQIAEEQAVLNKEIADLSHAADFLVEAVHDRPTKQSLAKVFAAAGIVLLIAFVVQIFILATALSILSDLDPSSKSYQERVDARAEDTSRADRISNCILEGNIIEQLNENFEGASLEPSETCLLLEKNYPEEFARAKEGN